MPASRHLAATTLALLAALWPHGEAAAWEAGPMCVAPDHRSVGEAYGLANDPGSEAYGPSLYRTRGPLLLTGGVASLRERVDGTLTRRARARAAAGELDAALHALDAAEASYPEVVDHLALLRGDLCAAAGRHGLALAAYERAKTSADSTVHVLADVGRVRALFALDRPEATGELEALFATYPELPSRVSLRLAEADSVARRGEPEAAAALYRALDLAHPGSPEAREARAKLAALGTQIEPRPLSPDERVARGELLAWGGPMPDAREAIAALLADDSLSRDLRVRVYSMAARVARVEGRFDDRARFERAARVGRLEPATEAPAVTAEAHERELKATLRELLHGRSMRRASSGHLLKVAEFAAREGHDDTLREVLNVAVARDLSAEVLYNLALLASGGPLDADALAVLEPLTKLGGDIGSGARYHYARTLYRLGRLDEAAAAFEKARAEDATGVRYYAMWSELELARLREERAGQGAHGELALRSALPQVGPAAHDAAPSSATDAPRPSLPTPRLEGFLAGPSDAPPPNVDASALASALSPIATTHAVAFPELGRAVALLRLGELPAAQNELYEAFLSWRQAIGRPIRRVGLEAIARGDDRPRVRPSAEQRRARAELPEADRRAIADVAVALEDYGTAIGLSPDLGADDRPRAYAHAIEAAAASVGLDPNLLFAIMRVESVYQRSIVSYAGAIGLTQIMPRTGRLIADALDEEDFTTADLLVPETNLRFAAWYLASLIRRFDGRLPLAIASYNGGPHNVLAWIDAHARSMPLDALLERIPFTQTHRYVRRVLTHYAAYRAQQGLAPTELSVVLPAPGADPVGF